MFKSLYTWEWQKNFVPPEVQKKRKHLVNITAVKLTVPERDGPVIAKFPINPVCLVTGDGRTLPEDVKAFEAWGRGRPKGLLLRHQNSHIVNSGKDFFGAATRS